MPKGIYIRTKKIKQILSDAALHLYVSGKRIGFQKGNSFGFNKGDIPWNKDKHYKIKDSSKMIGPKGKHWKIKDTSKWKGNSNGFQKGNQFGNKFKKGHLLLNGGNKGKHWKLKEKTIEKRIGERNGKWTGGPLKYKERQRLKLLKQQEKLAGSLRPEHCEVCDTLGKICFDHSHDSIRFRGWICSRCNLVLGLVKDNPELLISLSVYLTKSKK